MVGEKGALGRREFLEGTMAEGAGFVRRALVTDFRVWEFVGGPRFRGDDLSGQLPQKVEADVHKFTEYECQCCQ